MPSSLLLLAGLDNIHDIPPRDTPFTPQEAAQVLAVLLRKPVTLASFPPRMAMSHLLREVLEGHPGPRRDIVLLNAAAALVAGGAAASLREGIALAATAIDSGAAAARLDKLREISHGA